ncbi:unnamed protein product [Ixodes hexagonus]
MPTCCALNCTSSVAKGRRFSQFHAASLTRNVERNDSIESDGRIFSAKNDGSARITSRMISLSQQFSRMA